MQSNPGADFPLEEINATIATTNITTIFDDYAIDDVLRKTYRGKQTFLALSLLYDEATWGTMPFDQDHIFASSLFKPKELSSLDRLDWIKQKDRLGNLCLILAQENMGKQDMAVDEWLATREPGFLKRHLIPDDKSLWTFERFPEFLAAREELIRARLKSLFEF
jgi:hypothetical protein